MVDPDLPAKSLSIKGLRAGYGSLDILNGVDLDVPQGQFVALMGPNGAGKSTLLKSLYGMTTIKGGSIEWRDKNIAGYKSRAILAEGIAFVPQGRCNFPVMTIDENLQMAAYTLRDDKVKSDRDYVYDLFPILKARRNTLAGNMSGGEQQLLEVAMAGAGSDQKSCWWTNPRSVFRLRPLPSSSTSSYASTPVDRPFCSTSRMVWPPALMRSSSLKTMAMAAGERPTEGSSTSRIFGRCRTAIATSSNCCSPPDMLPASVLRRAFRIGNRS